MPVLLQRTPGGRRTWAALALLGALLTLPVGCELLRAELPPEPAVRSSQIDSPLPLPPAPTPSTLPGKSATRRGNYVFYHDFELDPADPLFTELEALPEQIARELRLPPTPTVIQVFLFDNQERYERYMFAPKSGRYRHLPSRRAYFIAEPRLGGTGDDLKVFTWVGDHLRTDLRHELTHALLHGVLKDVPLWLDEGLAGFFELPPANDGVNPHHLEILRRGPFQPDLARLEKLDQVKQMEKPEYREAWAWVHLLLRGDPATRKVLHDYLQSLRTTANPGSLWTQLQDVHPDPNQVLADHLESLELPRPRSRPR
jgi:hypothetical protein